jgi:hypothetical protein
MMNVLFSLEGTNIPAAFSATTAQTPCFFSGIPSTVTSSTGNMLPMDQQRMLEYTNSPEAVLKTTQEHTTSFTTAQSQLLHKLDSQQQDLLTQTTKFMTLLNTRTPKLTPPSTSTRQCLLAQNTHTKNPPLTIAIAIQATKILSNMRTKTVSPTRTRGLNVIWLKFRIHRT